MWRSNSEVWEQGEEGMWGFPGWDNKKFGARAIGAPLSRRRGAPSSARSPGPPRRSPPPPATRPFNSTTAPPHLKGAATRSSACPQCTSPSAPGWAGPFGRQPRPPAQLRPCVPHGAPRACRFLARASGHSRFLPADAARGPPPAAGRRAP